MSSTSAKMKLCFSTSSRHECYDLISSDKMLLLQVFESDFLDFDNVLKVFVQSTPGAGTGGKDACKQAHSE